MLDARIRQGGEIKGVFCHEHVGPCRSWATDERAFSVAVANLASLALEGAERHRAEEQVRLQSSALEAAANAIVITNRDGVIEWVNPAFVTSTGYSATEAVGKKPGELLKSGKHEPAFYQAVWQTIGAGAVWQGEMINRRKDGTLYTEEMTITPLKDAGGGITHFIAVKQDITERKQAAENLAKLNERFDLATRSAGLGIWDWDLVRNHMDWDDQMLRLYGVKRGEFTGAYDAWVKGLHPDDRARSEMESNMALRGEREFDTEFRVVWPDGSVHHLKAAAQVVRNADGQPLRMTGINYDITERRKLEEQYRQAQKMEGIGQLASGVAHDFNNILAVIQMQAGLLKCGDNLSPEDDELVDDIGAAVERAATLTRQLLLFSRKEIMRQQDLDLNQSIESMIKMLHRTIGEDVGVQLKLAAQPMYLHADPGMMDQVLLNLAVNARDAMPKGGELIIETSAADFDKISAEQKAQARPGYFVCLSVTDTGCGISPENIARIFEPFFTTKEIGKGTGLGLATVFGIVQQHHGWINVDSEVGHGTTFRIYLPRLAELSGKKSPETTVTTLPGGNEIILLVEDDSALRVMVNLSLSRLGYQVLEAANGIEALAVWKEHRDEIQLMLTDMVMPGGMNGIELGEQLLKDNPKLKVIYTSGYSAEVAGQEFPLKEGVNFLHKPFLRAHLAQALRAMLDAEDRHTGSAIAS